MNDLISRQAAIEKIHSEFDECLVWDESGKHTADEVERILDTIPPADVRPVRRGRWIKVNGKTAINCSACYHCSWSRVFEDTVKQFNFCPNCGADMRGGDAE